MFKVEENLILTKNAVLQDSFVVEDCGKYYEELSGFYVCLPKNRIDAIKQYMGTVSNIVSAIWNPVRYRARKKKQRLWAMSLIKWKKTRYGFRQENFINIIMGEKTSY